MTPETQQAIEAEVKRFGADLNLSDDQKAQFRTGLENASKKLDEMKASGQTVDPAVARKTAQDFIAKVLTPEQLTKWTAEMAKAKTFLGV